jgi:methyl coenzyme M reductase beta subunit
MINYFWAWKDDYGLHLLQADTFAEIIKDVIDFYSDDDAVVVVKNIGKSLQVQVSCYGLELDSKVGLDIYSVSNFLAVLAKKFDRKDEFKIMEFNY